MTPLIVSLYHSWETQLASSALSILSSNTLNKTRQLHALILIATPPNSTPFLYNNLISLYSKCGSLKHAQKVFDTMPSRNLVSYNAMISSYSKSNWDAAYAFNVFRKLCSVGIGPSASTLSSLVRAAACLRELFVGRAVHSKAVRFGLLDSVPVQTALLGMYSDNGCIEAANCIFGEMTNRDVVAWNVMMFTNVKSGYVEEGLRYFGDMVDAGLAPNICTFSIVFSACGKLENHCKGRIMHGKMIKSELDCDIPLQNALINMYASCGDMTTARLVFERIENPNQVSWNSIISGYSDVGNGEMAMTMLNQLRTVSCREGPQPDEYTFASAIFSIASLSSMFYGKPLHCIVNKMGVESSIFVGNTLINMYFLNNEPDAAQKLFKFIPGKDVVAWTEMVAGHSRLGEGELAMRYFHQMYKEGHKGDCFSLSSALNSAADLALLKQGEMLHAQVVKLGCEENMYVCGSLVDMYAKNGNLESANLVFERIENPDLQCWNSIIGGYGNLGDAEQTFKLFNQMTREGLQADHVTYVSLLSTCSHCTLVERGRFYWFCMMTDNIKPRLKHYTCMVNLLSRAGLLQEAKEFIIKSAFNESSELWRILLSSCVTFKELHIGVHASENILLLEPGDVSTYVLLSKLYANVGRWDNVAEIEKKITEQSFVKEPGLSWLK